MLSHERTCHFVTRSEGSYFVTRSEGCHFVTRSPLYIFPSITFGIELYIILKLKKNKTVRKKNINRQKLKENINRQNHSLILSQSPVSRKQKKQLVKPVRRRTWPLREAISTEIYEFLMNQQKPVNITDFVWARNRVTITILRISGLRVNEVRVLTSKQLQDSFNTKELQVYQSKTNTCRKVPLTDAGLAILKRIEKDLELVFNNSNEWCLGNNRAGRLMRQDDWVKIINRFIKPAAEAFDKPLSSHSFRVSYITALLKSMSIGKVRAIIGHKNIATTATYDRYTPNRKEILRAIDQFLFI
uniref:Tyr recombinase domain-containing protein n=1 Tax=Coleochaete scutata TaxID=3125 RepID=A0A5P9NVZ8_COLSC|nr:hypothetical protein [Coleochaete scutata]QFU80105.1 hypothetical protein [Coleochaete scutata]